MAIGHAGRLRQGFVPSCLNIVQHKLDELVFGFLLSVLLGVLPAIFVGLRRSSGTGVREDRKKVLVEDQAQNSNYQRAPDAEVHTPKTAKPSAATAIVTTIFNVLVGTARRPLHSVQLSNSCSKSIRTAEDRRAYQRTEIRCR